MSKTEKLKDQIFSLIKEYHNEVFKEKPFIPGETAIPVSGKLIDYHEIINITESALDAWFTTGRFNTLFEKAC